MLQADWCPSLAAGAAADVGDNSQATRSAAAKRIGAAAARASNLACHDAETLPAAIQSNHSWKFSSAVIASNVNQNAWPRQLEQLEKADGPIVCASEKFVLAHLRSDAIAKSITMPADFFPAFLEAVARQEAREKSSRVSAALRSVNLLPPVSAEVSMDDLVNAVSRHRTLAAALERIQFAGISANPDPEGAEAAAFTAFLTAATKLKAISVTQCSAPRVAAQIAAAAKDSTVEHVTLESNNLGLAGGDTDAVEEVRVTIAEMLKMSKFLVSLDLAHNNFTSEHIVSFLAALADSDTKPTPDEYNAQKMEDHEDDESGDPVPIEDLLDRELFLGDNSDEEEEDAEEEEEEPEPEEIDEEDEGYRDGSDDGSANASAGEEEAEEDQKDASDDEEDDEEAVFVPDPVEMRRIHRAMRQTRTEEKTLRDAVKGTYLTELLQVAQEIILLRKEYADEVEKQTAEYCQRRSGWSHLQSLTLRGNSVGDRGCRATARVLQSTVALGEEEMTRTEDELRENVAALTTTLRAARAKAIGEEVREWRAMEKQFLQERKAIHRAKRAARRATDTTITTTTTTTLVRGSMEADADEEDEFQDDASDILLTNVEDDDDEEEEEDDEEPAPEDDQQEDEGSPSDDEQEAAEEVDDAGLEDIDWEGATTGVDLHVMATKRGMNSITLLDLGSCGISSRGLESLAKELGESAVLQTLILRNNNLVATGSTKRSSGTPSAASPPGFAAFAAAVAANTALRTLDLGYCGLNPASIKVLAQALRSNHTLASLDVESNHFLLADAAGMCLDTALLALLGAISESKSLRSLNLSHNAIGECLAHEGAAAAAALAAVSATTLTHLYLSSAGLGGKHVSEWAECIKQVGHTTSTLQTLHLGRSGFTGEEAGECLARLLSCLAALQELCLDENPRLSSSGLAAALRGLPASPGSSLRWLSCNSVGARAPAVPPEIAAGLRYLAVGDLEIDGSDAALLSEWAAQIQAHCGELRYLSLWCRRLPMEANLPTLEPIVAALTSLRFVDFGVLSRFDMEPDLKDCLGNMEDALVARRVAECQ